jgi:hypothetical protein
MILRRECIDRTKLYFVDDSIRGVAISNTPLNGQYKWMGGFIHNDIIYGVPYNADTFFILDTTTETVTKNNFGLDLSGEGKWWGAVLTDAGIAYCIPHRHNQFLVLDLNNQTATLTDFGLDLSQDFMFANATMDDTGKIYCCPYNSESVLIVDTSNNTASLEDYGIRYLETNKYTSAVFKDGKVIMFPDWEDKFLIIDTDTQTATQEPLSFPMLAKGGNFLNAIITNTGIIRTVGQNNPRIASINLSGGTVVAGVSSLVMNGLSKFSTYVEDDNNLWTIPFASNLCIKLKPEAFALPDDINLDFFSKVIHDLKDNKDLNTKTKTLKQVVDGMTEVDSNPITTSQRQYLNDVLEFIDDAIVGFEQVEDSWSDAFLASNGKIYGVPYNARGVLVIQ